MHLAPLTHDMQSRRDDSLEDEGAPAGAALRVDAVLDKPVDPKLLTTSGVSFDLC